MLLKLIKNIDSWCFVFIFLLPFVVFYQGVWGNKIITAGDFSGSDLLDMQLPLRYALHEGVKEGRIPLWSQHIGNGFPIFAEGQGGFLYPLNLLFLSFTPEKALNCTIIITFSIAGCGAYLFSRRLPGLSRFASVCIAISFMFSSFFVARVKHLNLITVSAWLPWLLLIGQISIWQERYRLLLVASLIWTVQMFGGHPQMLYFSLIIFLWWCLGEFILLKTGERGRFRQFLRSKVLPFGGWLLLSIGLFVGLSAVQWLPTQELIGYSYRSVNSLNSFYSATAFPLHPVFFTTFYFPYVLGNPADASYRYDIQTIGVWWENVMYMGLLPALVLTGSLVYFFAVFVKRYRSSSDFGSVLIRHLQFSSQRRRYVYFISISVLFFLTLALGKLSILYFAVYEIVPGMKLFRFPNRFNLFVIFGLCLLFGFFIDYWFRRLRQFRFKRLLQGGIIAFVIFDLGLFSWSYISFMPIGTYTSYFVDSWRIGGLQNKQDFARYYPAAQYSPNPYLFKGWKEKAFPAIASFRNVYAGHNAIIFDMNSFTDRDWAEGGLDIYRLSQIEERLLGEKLDSSRINSSQAAFILGLFNVKYVFSFYPLDHAYYTLSEEHTLDPYFTDTLKIYLNNKAVPRAYLTKNIKYETDEKVLENLFSEQHPHGDFAYISSSDQSGGDVVGVEPDQTDNRFIDITSYRDHMVVMKSASEYDSFLVFSDLYYPGWKAFLDGQEVPVLRANLVQRAIRVPGGDHIIEWRYEPDSFKTGVYISAASVIVFLLLLAIPFKIKRYAK